MLNHDAVYALYPNVVSVDDGEGAFDANGDRVEIDLDAVNAWVDPNAYKYQRRAAYPSIQDQLDMLYHEGYDGWKAAIEAIKNQYPKP